jgi:hypothetical protein
MRTNRRIHQSMSKPHANKSGGLALPVSSRLPNFRRHCLGGMETPRRRCLAENQGFGVNR